jgi:O-antigen/teichoic acid export membrane protein
VGRHIAHYRSQNDINGILNTLNTAVFALSIVGAICICVMLGLSAFLPRLGESRLPAELIPETRTAMLIVGVQLAIFLQTRIFDATLWGHQRFDLMNMVDIPAAFVRGIGSALAIGLGYGLIGLAFVTLATTTAVGVAKLILSLRVEPRIRPAAGHVHWKSYKELWSFGVWNMLLSFGVMARTQMSPFAIQFLLGLGSVAPFSVASRLVNMASTLMSGGIGIVTPYAVELHAHNDLDRQRKLFLDTGKFCVGGAVYFLALFVFLGRSIIVLWIKKAGFEQASIPLAILACGELVPLSVGMAYNTMFGMARNRALAVVGIAECVTAISIGALLSSYFGLEGMCFGFAIASTVWRGIFSFVQAARLIELRFGQFLQQTLLPMLLAVTGPVILLAAATNWKAPDTWLQLLVYGFVFTVLYGSAGVLAAWGWDGVRTRLLSRFAPASNSAAMRAE